MDDSVLMEFKLTATGYTAEFVRLPLSDMLGASTTTRKSSPLLVLKRSFCCCRFAVNLVFGPFLC